jgi:hypothetical protein
MVELRERRVVLGKASFRIPYKIIVRQMGEITCNSGEVFLSFVLLGLRWKCEGTGLTAA